MAVLFKHKITYFKQYNIYFYTLFHSHIYIKNTRITLFKLTHQQGPRICELLLVYRQYQLLLVYRQYQYRMDLTGFFQD